MPNSNPLKIVYLLGAGATHAEIINLYPKRSSDALFLEKNGLLISQVSKRVFRNASNKKIFQKGIIKKFLTRKDLSNIELFISLIGDNRIRSEEATEKLKRLIEEDITERLNDSRLKRFYLHKALLELHAKINDKEELLGFISLNYDHVLDRAYEDVNGGKNTNYYLSSKQPKEKKTPILKLHGGFNLKDERGRKIPIITPGINKNYLELPYNFIWGRALEILIECDILRVIGCSLSQNDIGLVDLLFKAHLAREGVLEVEIINSESGGRHIKEAYGFFPGIKTAYELENKLITDVSIERDPSSNPFKIWLRAKGARMLENQINKTKYLKKVIV